MIAEDPTKPIPEVSPNPFQPSGLETDSPWFIYNKATKESLVKGDKQLMDGKRIPCFMEYI